MSVEYSEGVVSDDGSKNVIYNFVEMRDSVVYERCGNFFDVDGLLRVEGECWELKRWIGVRFYLRMFLVILRYGFYEYY